MRISDWSSDVCSSDLYSYFDTLVNDYMIRFGGLDMVNDPVIGLVVETACRFHQPIGFPETVEACLRTAKLGNSSVRHEIGLLRDGQPHPAATGHFVHVFVERGVQKPVPIPPAIRPALEKQIGRAAGRERVCQDV